ncbi:MULTISPECIES: tol-pal system protein YbgF [Devosia]|uniref:Cell division coordinator CpoB n=1 Tax=Devosia equisanguinis TaxID=2490941 RepID=A0A3S4EKW1_9HYPH|nr:MULTISPECIES: tol-pal system protein YbgF [Devosia]ODT48815.1 MAG: tol-pal system protein YbgF [Pelagibacterium sp. SCN 63-126]ODU86896.1 MAG: tol-pal system protein YbgF [Pelagibacterium sp. SCN 63-17]OJX44257.1 MAG: tol-pal system protein YbgF [Devosia sp. 63-57]VDS04251.1 tol-pal system protein YbgF [Devosia equisanguinis]
MTLSRLSKFGRAALCALGVGLVAPVPATMAQTTLPPAELAGLSFTNGGRVLVAQADQAQLMVRIQQLEEQIRLLNGQVEGLTFQITQMQEILTRFQEDAEFRFQALEGGAGGKTEAATQPGGVTQPEALPQSPGVTTVPTDAAPSPTIIPEQGVQPLPGEQEFDPTFDDGSVGESADPLVGTGQGGSVDLVTGQPLNLSYDPRAVDSGNADADAQFAAGYQAIVEGDYAFAEDQFSQFLALYPNHPQVTDAANWLGEALLVRGAYDQAAEVLLDAYQKAPDSPRAPDLLLKIGVSLSGAGERETACRTLTEVNLRYPDTAPAFKTRVSEEMARAECPPA